MRQRAILIVVLALLSTYAWSFEVKGYTTGEDLAQIDLKGCEAKDDVDSGVPGYVCMTTLGGEQAVLRIAVFENKVVAVLFSVKNALMTPILDALKEKYGSPYQSNRFIERYTWSKGRVSMSIDQNRVSRGYSLSIVDHGLFAKASAANKEKAKKDL